MNRKILLLAISAAVFSSCSTTYKSGQTPDDLYYSPARVVSEKVEKEKKEEIRTVRRSYEDRQIVMGIYDRRWRNFNDDYDAFYDPYKFGYSCGYYYNPYYYPWPVYVSGAVFTNPKNTTPRMTNLGSYNYSNMVVMNPKAGSTRMIKSTRQYNNSNTDNNLIRRIIPPSNNRNNNYNDNYRPVENNTRSYTPSNNTRSSTPSSGSGGSGAPVSRPQRGG